MSRKKKEDKAPKATVQEEETPEAAVQEVEAPEVAVQEEKESSPAVKSTMQTTVSRLREILKLLQPIVPKKSNLPVLKNVLLKDGQAIANNLEVAAVIDFPAAAGQFLIPHTAIQELLKFVPGNDVLTIEGKGKKLKLSWDSGKASFDVEDPADFPEMPKVEEKIAVSFDGDRLIAAMASVVGYCVAEDNRPVLKGINLTIGETIEVAAADGFRLAIQTLPISSPVEDSMIIPDTTVEILSGLWKQMPPGVPLQETLVGQVMSKRQLKLVHGDGTILLQFGLVTLVCKLIEGTFPSYRKLIPSESPIHLRLFAPDLERAVLSVKVSVKGEDSSKVYLKWNEDTLTVSAEGEKSETEAKIGVQVDGAPGYIAINYMYLLEYLGGKEGLVTIGVTTPQSPILLHHGMSPLVMLMPMFAAAKT